MGGFHGKVRRILVWGKHVDKTIADEETGKATVHENNSKGADGCIKRTWWKDIELQKNTSVAIVYNFTNHLSSSPKTVPFPFG